MKLILLKQLLKYIDDNSKLHIFGKDVELGTRCELAKKDDSLNNLIAKSIFVSTMDSASIGIEIGSSIETDTALEDFSEDIELTIDILANNLYLGAKEIIIRTKHSYLFAGNHNEFVNYLECFKHRKIVKLKRLYIGDIERNVIEIEVEEEIPPLQISSILPYLYQYKQVTIMEWNQDWLYCGNADKIDGEILDRYVDKFFTTAQLPNRLVIMLKHK